MNTHAMQPHPENACEVGPDDKRVLIARPHFKPVVAPVRDIDMRLEMKMVDARDIERVGEHLVGRIEAGIRISVCKIEFVQDVLRRIGHAAAAHSDRNGNPRCRAVEKSRRIVCQRLFHRHERWQLFIIDLDRLCGAERRRLVHGDDCGDRVSDIAHTVERNHRLIAQTDAVELVCQWRDVLAGHNADDARHRQRSGRIDFANAGMRHRTAQQLAMQKARK